MSDQDHMVQNPSDDAGESSSSFSDESTLYFPYPTTKEEGIRSSDSEDDVVANARTIGKKPDESNRAPLVLCTLGKAVDDSVKKIASWDDTPFAECSDDMRICTISETAVYDEDIEQPMSDQCRWADLPGTYVHGLVDPDVGRRDSLWWNHTILYETENRFRRSDDYFRFSFHDFTRAMRATVFEDLDVRLYRKRFSGRSFDRQSVGHLARFIDPISSRYWARTLINLFLKIREEADAYIFIRSGMLRKQYFYSTKIPSSRIEVNISSDEAIRARDLYRLFVRQSIAENGHVLAFFDTERRNTQDDYLKTVTMDLYDVDETEPPMENQTSSMSQLESPESPPGESEPQPGPSHATPGPSHATPSGSGPLDVSSSSIGISGRTRSKAKKKLEIKKEGVTRMSAERQRALSKYPLPGIDRTLEEMEKLKASNRYRSYKHYNTPGYLVENDPNAFRMGETQNEAILIVRPTDQTDMKHVGNFVGTLGCLTEEQRTAIKKFVYGRIKIARRIAELEVLKKFINDDEKKAVLEAKINAFLTEVQYTPSYFDVTPRVGMNMSEEEVNATNRLVSYAFKQCEEIYAGIDVDSVHLIANALLETPFTELCRICGLRPITKDSPCVGRNCDCHCHGHDDPPVAEPRNGDSAPPAKKRRSGPIRPIAWTMKLHCQYPYCPEAERKTHCLKMCPQLNARCRICRVRGHKSGVTKNTADYGINLQHHAQYYPRAICHKPLAEKFAKYRDFAQFGYFSQHYEVNAAADFWPIFTFPQLAKLNAIGKGALDRMNLHNLCGYLTSDYVAFKNLIPPGQDPYFFSDREWEVIYKSCIKYHLKNQSFVRNREGLITSPVKFDELEDFVRNLIDSHKKRITRAHEEEIKDHPRGSDLKRL